MIEIDKLENLLIEGNQVISTKRHPAPCVIDSIRVDITKFNKWKSKVISYLEVNLGSSNYFLNNFRNEVKSNKLNDVKKGMGILEALIESIKEELININMDEIDESSRNVENIFYKFHRIAIELSKRQHKREPLLIEDEYDLQYLLSSLLKLYFNDVRPEEYVPSYAGGNSRVDFFIKDIGVIIETKMTRSNLKDKQIGEQLIIDIERYSQRSDFSKLYCFVYDPDNYINNPEALESDLSKSGEFEVKVIIVPKF